MSNQLMRQAAQLLQTAGRTVVLTGAGLSTSSGIPDFRSPSSGLWNRVDPLAIASLWSFHDQPRAFYRWFLPLARQIRRARPNPAHLALAELERMGRVHLLITQNIDGLHQQAGSSQVIEIHGHLRSATCLECGQHSLAGELWPIVDRGDVPFCPACGGLLKPDVILFGESLDYDLLRTAQEAALHCDLLIAAGSSLEVEPAADLPFLARRRGAHVIIVNRQPTLADSIAEVVIRGDVADILPRLAEDCRIQSLAG